ncbi:MAG: glycosyltransferase family 4 protein [Deltaproteobacteria bacterium]|nr:glycosyltransferase family 4 protein [Deltaproteobacteria bacterium]
MTVKLAFTMFKYFPYGGLQRDALRIAELCRKAGAEVEIYAARLQGEPPAGVDFTHLPGRGVTHHRQYIDFSRRFQALAREKGFAAVVGFNKMPGLDLYFAADPCFLASARQKGPLARLTGRYRTFAAFEKAVFDPAAETVILSISELQKRLFMELYGTPAQRFCDLPPGVPADRLLPPDSGEMGRELRRELGIRDDELMILMVGSGFKRKGVDRALQAVKALPGEISARTRLVVVGDDDLAVYRKMAQRLKVAERVVFTGGRTDVTRFLAAADLFFHPARQENTGGGLIEALAAGLPVLVTGVCGYSVHIERAGAGIVTPEPFSQEVLNEALSRMAAEPEQRRDWRRKALDYVSRSDLFSLAEKAAAKIIEVAKAKRQG